MTYLQLSAWFVAAAVVSAIVLSLLAGRHRAHAGGVAATVVALVILTAIFDTVMIATGLFHYSPEHLLGVHIGLAPLEDFAYPIAGAILLPALWAALRTRRRAQIDGGTDAEAAS
ncbi:lycopene cyclase domain-containing protein [Microbacterium sp. CGR1]|uniref:lycopene cyclase domain-containing protein n=1 Tax=Microbacterium sp. CGR1 TaxID=1696072 RepID=UPI003DA6702E